MNNNNLEIERKFLIEYPDDNFFRHASDKSDIVQTYLSRGTSGTERVRKRGLDGNYTYTHTVKRSISDMRRVEIESEISEEEYNELLRYADTTRSSVLKTRYILDYEGQSFEIDVYPFWSDRAVMELELENEEQVINFPPYVKVIREVTEDRRYRNNALAKSIPND